MKRALITGITGMDGSHLTELLLEKGYVVHGLVRRSSSFNTGRIDHLYRDQHEEGDTRLHLHYGDVTDASCLNKVLREVQPDEIYNLAAMSHVRLSFDMPEYTSDVVALGTVRLLEAAREITPKARIYQASSSELFGSQSAPQSETTPFHPRSPYATAKAFAFYTAVNYREAYKMHVSNGILFNHTSPRRGETFVERKITRAVGRIKAGLQSKLFLGNLNARRDWGAAEDYVRAMWLMLQEDEPDDYVIATGESHSVMDVLKMAFGMIEKHWELHVEIDQRYFRPAEVDHLRGIATKAREKLGWRPLLSFRQIIERMVEHDLRLARKEAS